MFCLEYLALVDRTKKSFGKCMSKLSSPTLPPAPVPCASLRAFSLPAAPRALLLPGCYTLLFWCLHGISSCVPNVVSVSHICLETPRAAAEQFPQQSNKLSYFFNLPQKPRNLYPLTAFGPGAKGRGPGGAGQIPSAGRYCAVVYFGSTDAIDSCVQSSGVTNS